MIIQFSTGDAEALCARLRALLRDVEGIASGRLPSPSDLAGAPTIMGWEQAADVVPILAGAVVDPSGGGARLVRTSEIFVFAPDAGWARTSSRFFRLGASAADLERRQ